jgi:hypothetical protein
MNEVCKIKKGTLSNSRYNVHFDFGIISKNDGEYRFEL